ncbi:MAG: hypothetical protein H8D23_05040 [Candidatus Brocadiales bacterium]|nr:hypothetical protein [Candidatus Brocadiales bacterium]
MAAKINELVTGEYDHTGDTIIYGDTDSETGDTIHKTNWGELTVEELFNRGTRYWSEDNSKEYSANDELKVLTFDPVKDEAYYGNINYIYRHKVSKEQWEIEDEAGNTIRVTGDHSIMIERDGQLMDVKPRDMLDTDVLIVVDHNVTTKPCSYR